MNVISKPNIPASSSPSLSLVAASAAPVTGLVPVFAVAGLFRGKSLNTAFTAADKVITVPG